MSFLLQSRDQGEEKGAAKRKHRVSESGFDACLVRFKFSIYQHTKLTELLHLSGFPHLGNQDMVRTYLCRVFRSYMN
jgi:hypothetical protein